MMWSHSSQLFLSIKPVNISENSPTKTPLYNRRTNLTTDEIISLLDFTLSNNYFVYSDSIYKKIHAYAMGNPVSSVVANL